jgi:glucokinase
VNLSYALGIDAGATNVKGVAVSLDGKILVKRSVTIRERQTLPSAVASLAADVVGEIGRAPDAFGIAAPGIAAPDGRTIWWMQGRRAEVQGLHWGDYLRQPAPVPVINDAQAALLGEAWQGAAKGCDNVTLLTLGTGVGGAALVDGRLLRGHLGRAGHLGHICLDPRGSPDIVNTPGSLEDAIGDCTIERRSAGRFKSTADLLAATDEGAAKIWSDSIRALACGIASLINVLDPEIVILGGGMIAVGDRLFVPLRAELDKVEWRPHDRCVKIVPASAGEYAGALGAAFNAFNQVNDAVPR